MGRKWWIIVELMDFGKFSSVAVWGAGEKNIKRKVSVERWKS